MAVRVAICGCGRLGRLAIMSMLKDSNIEIVAINDRHETSLLAGLLEFEIGHKVGYDTNNIIINDIPIPVIKNECIETLPWAEMGVDVVVENSINRTKEEINKHILAGAKRVFVPVPPEEISPNLLIPMINKVVPFEINDFKNDIYYNRRDYKNDVKLLKWQYHNSKRLPNKKNYH